MRLAFVVGAIAIGALLTGCPCGKDSKMPTGPSPEYEDPPPPSWFKEAGASSPAATVPVESPPAQTPIAPAPDAG